MSSIDFYEENQSVSHPRTLNRQSGGGMVRFLIRIGVVKDEKGALVLLGVLAGILFISAICIFWYTSFKGSDLPAVSDGSISVEDLNAMSK